MKKKPSFNQKEKTLAVIRLIHQAASLFESQLAGKTFLYVYEYYDAERIVVFLSDISFIISRSDVFLHYLLFVPVASVSGPMTGYGENKISFSYFRG